MEFISVIIPTRNRMKLLVNAIESVIKQDYHPLEILVVDDGSTDGTADTIKNLPTELVRYFYNSTSVHGPEISRNIGIENARGDYIAWLDDDDEYLPGKLNIQKTYLDEHPEAELVFTRIREFVQNPEIPLDTDITKAISFTGSRVYHASMLARRETYEKVGNYKKIFADGREDQDWLYRAQFLHRVNLNHCIEAELLARRVHQGSISYHSRNSEALQKAAGVINGYIRQSIRQRLKKGSNAG